MERRKGFTLIELLAVIVILAVIALIATPLIMGTIRKAKMNSLKDSAYGILKTANQYQAEQMVTMKGEAQPLILMDLEAETELEYKGKKPKCGYLIVENNKDLIVISDGQYVARKAVSKNEVTVDKGTCEDVLKEIDDIGNPVQDGLQVYFDGTNSPVLENGQMVWKDKSKNHYDGVLKKFESIDKAWVNKGVAFHKDGRAIFLPSSLDTFPTGSYTIEAYVKEDSYPPTDSTYHKFVIKRNGAGGDPYLFIGSRNRQWYGAPGSLDVFFSNQLVGIDYRHLLTMTYDKETEKTKLYLDGILLLEKTSHIEPYVQGWTIGGASDFDHVTDGIIHSVRMYNKPLTEQEIYKNYVTDLYKYGV